jgi:hypothetical protein
MPIVGAGRVYEYTGRQVMSRAADQGASYQPSSGDGAAQT